ncbi:MAG: cob(I)alamin adenosyltransferase [Myxococcota bacterium]|jgi:cob(I)alamin adenosyltransferase
MRISRVYTRTGDKGTTRLAGGQEVSKDALRVEAYGAVDELSTILGLARTFNAQTLDDDVRSSLESHLKNLQNDLFNVGGDLATPPDSGFDLYRVGDEDVARLEQLCDSLNEDLGPLKDFILPGGGPVGAFLHQARTVCRRAERRLVTAIHGDDSINQGCLRFLNRLSDFLFILARWANKQIGEPEFLWQKPVV